MKCEEEEEEEVREAVKVPGQRVATLETLDVVVKGKDGEEAAEDGTWDDAICEIVVAGKVREVEQ